MNSRPPTKTIPWLGLLLALLGVAFCLYAGSDHGQALCLTTGCALNKNFSIFGVSAWHVGAGALAAYALLALIGGLRVAQPIAALLLAGDCLFLLLMAATLPCAPCLGAALIFALVFTASRPRKNDAPPSRLLAAWLLLFLFNGLLLGRELLTPPPLFGAADAPLKLYFSPSCPACHQAVQRYAPLAAKHTAAFYPVAETEADLAILNAMQAHARAGLAPDAALTLALAQPSPPSPWSLSTLLLRWRLRANQATVLTQGHGAIPLIIQEGLPADFREQGEAPWPGAASQPAGTGAPARPESDPAGLEPLFDLSLQSCHGAGPGEPCPLPE